MERINFGIIYRWGLTTSIAVVEMIDRMVYDSNSNKKMNELYSIMNNRESVLTKFDGIQIFVSMYGLTEEERKIVESIGEKK